MFHHKHLRPACSALWIPQEFNLTDFSFALLFPVILLFTVITEFPVSIEIVSRSSSLEICVALFATPGFVLVVPIGVALK